MGFREVRRVGWATCLTVAACSGGDATSPDLPLAEGPVASVRMTLDTITMEVGVLHEGRATPIDSQGVTLDGREIRWSVDRPEIATVTAEGMVTSLAVGSTTLTATSEGISGTAQIVVVTSASQPPSVCALVGSGPESYWKPRFAQSSLGALKVVMLFADFSDAPASESTSDLYDLLVPTAQAWFSEVSTGSFSLSVDRVDAWFRAPQPSGTYDWTTFRGHRRYISQVMGLADSAIDFSLYDAVFIVASRGADQVGSNAFRAFPGGGVVLDGHEIRSAVTFGVGIRSTSSPDFGALVTVHETGHMLGLPDLYLYDAPNWLASQAAVGMWDPMAWLGLGTHFVTWQKWKLRWLDDDRIDCLGRASVERTLFPFDAASGTQSLVLPTILEGYLQSAVVVEVRRARGFDSRICEEGVLVYSVYVNIPNGRFPIRVQSARLDRDPLLVQGEACGPLYESSFGLGDERISVFTDESSGVTVEVIEDLGDGYQVRIDRN